MSQPSTCTRRFLRRAKLATRTIVSPPPQAISNIFKGRFTRSEHRRRWETIEAAPPLMALIRRSPARALLWRSAERSGSSISSGCRFLAFRVLSPLNLPMSKIAIGCRGLEHARQLTQGYKVVPSQTCSFGVTRRCSAGSRF